MHETHAQNCLPRLNEPAPNFEAETTHGHLRLEDYAGRWLVLFSHPADFTPVCTSEFVAFSRMFPRFEEIDCDLLGLSVDSRFSHIAWVRSIEQSFGIEVPFPVIEDVSMRVASAYGMIHPGASDTSAVRTTFVIDPDGIIRALLVYPMTTGRCVDEILRLVQALQVSANHRVATPEGWRPGSPVVAPPPQTTVEAAERVAEGGVCPDWYFSEREAPSA
jgi:peroxiredoxin (alkyl hydroperoxide reductase subunit C)